MRSFVIDHREAYGSVLFSPIAQGYREEVPAFFDRCLSVGPWLRLLSTLHDLRVRDPLQREQTMPACRTCRSPAPEPPDTTDARVPTRQYPRSSAWLPSSAMPRSLMKSSTKKPDQIPPKNARRQVARVQQAAAPLLTERSIASKSSPALYPYNKLSPTPIIVPAITI